MNEVHYIKERASPVRPALSNSGCTSRGHQREDKILSLPPSKSQDQIDVLSVMCTLGHRLLPATRSHQQGSGRKRDKLLYAYRGMAPTVIFGEAMCFQSAGSHCLSIHQL